ncbi:MAG TPA: hypothetical protein VHM19_17710 [Polyangiales bacterium]|jgi:hypothetical protein|nr:hypothetical protein [Polyangiales bacterium]
MLAAALLSPALVRWLRAFAFTQLVEIPIYRRTLGAGFWEAFGASAITHPIVWFGFFSPYAPGTYLQRSIAAELFAWLVEAAYFRARGRRNALGWALVANGASVGLGLLSRSLFGAP